MTQSDPAVHPGLQSQRDEPHVYSFHGCCLSSTIALRSLAPWPESQSGIAPQITLELGETPSSLPCVLWSSPFIEIGADHSALVHLDAVARFWLPGGLDAGIRIIIQPSPSAQPFEIETILLGSVAGILLHQRGLLPLHASCVALGSHAIAISGPSASGKSALAAALVCRGATMLADDLCVINDEGHTIHAVSNTSHACLWPDVMDQLEIPKDLRRPTRAGHGGQEHGKHSVSMHASEQNVWPLRHLVRLSSSNLIAAPQLEPLRGLTSVFPQKELLYQPNIGNLFGNRALEFRLLTSLARHTSISSLRRTRVLDDLNQCADLILSAVSVGA